jgi:hypothetical protein
MLAGVEGEFIGGMPDLPQCFVATFFVTSGYSPEPSAQPLSRSQ